MVLAWKLHRKLNFQVIQSLFGQTVQKTVHSTINYTFSILYVCVIFNEDSPYTLENWNIDKFIWPGWLEALLWLHSEDHSHVWERVYHAHKKPDAPTHEIFALIIFWQQKATSKCLLLALLYALGKENVHQQKAYRSTSAKI